MIAFIKGQTAGKDNDYIILENGGMGYRIRVPDHILNEAVVGRELKLYTYMSVREDGISLFGFSGSSELAMFKNLLSISGIGPRVALSVLSTLSVEEIYYAVFGDDVKAITKTPGMGPKGAKRMIMELKDKLDMEELSHMTGGENSGSQSLTHSDEGFDGSSLSDAAAALVALGYSGTEALRALRSIEKAESMETEALLKEALKRMI